MIYHHLEIITFHLILAKFLLTIHVFLIGPFLLLLVILLLLLVRNGIYLIFRAIQFFSFSLENHCRNLVLN